ncbi:hypothetical protein SLEP1_g16285 [Rubroshorea leprosula]|uniref:Uncharacterized protein n=1 Tax=Rubroshorea leprosula TaxID=152421 RepID=A0AAV5J0Z9_9ROSI|nr:hypothetical protein SLEP1_g16285 [Rubroshorea leprosula]
MMFSNVILNRRGDLRISCSRRADLPMFLVQGLNCHNIAVLGRIGIYRREIEKGMQQGISFRGG